jgi:hypothetical protein
VLVVAFHAGLGFKITLTLDDVKHVSCAAQAGEERREGSARRRHVAPSVAWSAITCNATHTVFSHCRSAGMRSRR